MVAEIEPPKMMIMACSEMNMWRSPPMKIIAVMTMMPAMSPTLVMISMGHSNANATTAVLAAGAAQPRTASETLERRP